MLGIMARIPVCFLFLTTLMLLPLSSGAQAPRTVEHGWDLLFANDVRAARRHFTGCVQTGISQAEARSGLIICHTALGDFQGLARAIEDARKEQEMTPWDALLPCLLPQDYYFLTDDYFTAVARYCFDRANRDHLDPLLRRHFQELGAQFIAFTRDRNKVRETSQELGRLDKWSLLGPFENISGSGHRRRHITSWTAEEREYRGKAGQRVSWFNTNAISRSGVLIPTESFHHKTETTAYVRTAFLLPEKGTYLLSCGYRGDAVLALDGHPLHDGHHDLGRGETLAWEVELEKGIHEILVQISNRAEPPRLSVSLQHRDGSPIQDLVFRRNSPSDFSAQDIQPRALPHPLQIAIEEGFPQASRPEAAYFQLLARLWLGQEDLIFSLDRWLEVKPDSALMLALAARIAGFAGNQDERESYLLRACEMAPSLSLVVEPRARQLIGAGDYRQALDLLQPVLEEDPHGAAALDARLDALYLLEDMEGLEQEATTFRNQNPDHPLGLYHLVSVARERENYQQVHLLRQAMFEKMSGLQAALFTASISLRTEELKTARPHLADLVRIWPEFSSLRVLYIHALLAEGDHATAQAMLKTSLFDFPQNVEMLRLKARFTEAGYYIPWAEFRELVSEEGRILSESEFRRVFPTARYIPDRPISLDSDQIRQRYYEVFKADKAAEVLEQARNIVPGDYGIYSAWRELKELPSLDAHLPEPDVDSLLELKVDPADRSESALILQSWNRRFVFDTHASFVDMILAVQILDDEGADAWREWNPGISLALSDVDVRQAELIKANGRRIRATVTDTGVRLRHLEPDDVVVLNLRIGTRHLGTLAGHFWDEHIFLSDIPCLESRYTLIVPTGAEPATVLHPGLLPASIESRRQILEDEFVLLEWEAHDLPAAPDLPLAPETRVWAPWIDVSSIPTWREVAQWYADLADGQTQVTPRIAARARELTAHCRTPEDKLAALHHFVADEISYRFLPFIQSALVPRTADEVLRTGWGDCKDQSGLLIALLRASGFQNARFALTSPLGSHHQDYLPGPRFTHAIVGLKGRDGRFIWCDPTITGGRPDALARTLNQAPVLVADPGMGGYLDLPRDDSQGRQTIREEVWLNDQGDARITRTTTYRRAEDIARRRTEQENLDPDQWRKNILTRLSEDHPGVEMIDCRLEDGQGKADSLVTRVEFRNPGRMTVAADLITGPLSDQILLPAGLARLVADQERPIPIELRPLASTLHCEQIIQLPEGYEPMALPESVRWEWEGCHYRTDIETQGSRVLIHRELAISGDLVPAQEYPAFRAFLNQVLQDMRASFVARKKG